MNITLALCDICPATEADEFSVAMLNTFEFKNKGLELVQAAVTREIEATTSASDILRRNCVATKLLSIFAKEKGRHYLKLTLGPFLENITEEPADYAFEIDLSKLKDYEEYKDNAKRYATCLNEVFNALQKTQSIIPRSFRTICNTISRAVENKFPESKESAVGSFFFLRFLSPALVSPEQEGLLENAPSREIRRSLLLLAKTIQNIANFTGSKPPTTVCDLVDMEGKVKIVTGILRNICVLDVQEDGVNVSDTVSQASSQNARVMDFTQVGILHEFLYKHWDDAHHKLMIDQRKRRMNNVPTRQETIRVRKPVEERNGDGRHAPAYTAPKPRRPKRHEFGGALGSEDEEIEINRRFSALVRSLGRPSSPASAPLPTLRFSGQSRLYEFMARNEKRDLGPIIDRRVIQEGITKDGMPTLVVTYHNYNREELDTELVIYRFFQVASKMWTEKFSLFYDCTGCKPINLLSNTVRSIRDIMIPDEMAHNCYAVYYYNVSTSFLPALKSLIRHYSSGTYLNPQKTKYIFVTTADVKERCNVNGLNMDARSLRALEDVRLVYPGIQRLSTNKTVLPVTLKLGNEFLQIHGEQPFNYVKNSPGFCNDVMHLSNLANLYQSQTTGKPDEFTIELDDGEKIILFHKKRIEIMRAINSAKARLPEEVERPQKLTMNLEDAIGCLLNVGLSNLCSNEAEVQQAAFNLLATIPQRFNIDFGREIRGGNGLGIPKNEVTMAVAFSEAVATSHPELTYSFLFEFSKSFKGLPRDQALNAILYAAPWIKNVYRAQEEGQNDAAKLIREFLDITVWNRDHYTCLLLNFWPVLCLQEELTEILVDEVVSFAVDRASQDDDIEDVLAVITSFPTLSICGTVLSKCRRLLDKPLPTQERSLVHHPDWMELVVLTRLISALSFESLLIAEVFLPEIFLLITAFLYTGPYSFRVSLYNLLVNILHSFSCSEKLSPEQKDHIVSIWDEMASPKGRLLFGLSDEMKSMTYDYFVLASVNHIENCCIMMIDVIRSAGTVQVSNVWRARWSSLIMNACFIENPALQCRSFIVLGCLARIEVEDVVVTQVLTVFRDAMSSASSSVSEEFGACTMFCLTKMMDGLFETSEYHARMFWLGVSLLNAGNVTLFTHGLNLIQASLRSLDALGAFKETSMAAHLLEKRKAFEDRWFELDSLVNVQFSGEYFDLALCAVVLRGLEKSSTRNITLKALETFLEISAKNHIKSEKDTKKYASYLCYLYFLYLGCRSQADIKDLLWIAGYPDDHMESKTGEDELPTLLEEYISEDSVDTTIALYLGGQLFRATSEFDVSGTRFVESLRFVGEKNLQKKAMVYSSVRSRLLKLTEFGSQKPIMKSILAAGANMLTNLDELIRLEEHRNNLERLLVATGFGNMVEKEAPISPSNTTFIQNNELADDVRAKVANLIDAIILK
jgi:neurofibromin 1